MTPFASAAPGLRAVYAATAALALAALGAVLTAAVALAGLHQLQADLDFAAVPRWFWYFRGDPEVRRWLQIGALASGGLIAALTLGAVLGVRRPLHGAARFANESELSRAGLRDRQGLLLGRKGGAYLSFGGSEHVMLYAPTRSGKGVGVVIPNLLNWPDSVVVLDIKRENFLVTAGFRAAHGQTVHLFDPLAPDGRTARYNPLAYIPREDRTATLDELQKIAGMLFPATDKADPFWAEAARTGFVGVGAFVAETPALPFTLGEIFRQLTEGSPKLRFPEAVTARARAGDPLSAGCVSALTDFCSASENTFASIKQTITARMGLWLNPRVDAATSASDFDLRRLRGQPTSIYLCASPDNVTRLAPLYSLFFQQLVDLNCRELPAPGEVRQVLLLLDEFARLGHAGVIAHGFSFVAGYGLRILAVIQSPSQLRAEYGAELADEIMSNCGAEMTFTPKQLKVAQELSERLGYYTYASRSKSRPTALASGRRTTTESDQRRALMLPQELLQMPVDELLVLRAGAPPVRGRKIVYYRSRGFRRRLMPPPEISGGTPPAAQALGNEAQPTLAGLAANVAAIRTAVDEIHTVVIQRPMSESEAAGETSLSLQDISLAFDDVDMDELPAAGASEDEVRQWVSAYLDSATLEEILGADPPEGDGARRPEHELP
ncbi:type IV secretory system conjugative DNA transfer family protein [Phenylobacterium sp. LjRoot219]|uniref:type IV secretory system conjugative DNA transfer family protein n=1 Tax=Phenylobacterium sp. LjRoot219 TaxID=3342283 RepID=UPI003ED089C3